MISLSKRESQRETPVEIVDAVELALTEELVLFIAMKSLSVKAETRTKTTTPKTMMVQLLDRSVNIASSKDSSMRMFKKMTMKTMTRITLGAGPLLDNSMLGSAQDLTRLVLSQVVVNSR